MGPTLHADIVERLLGLVLIAAGGGALGIAYTAQFVYGLEPCPLCLYQRVPYAVLIALGLVLGFGPASWRQGALAMAALAFAVGAGIAVYHVGVEQQWWASAVCGGEIGTVTSPDQLLQGLSGPPAKACDEVDWTFLGFSMATWNAAFSALMAAALFGTLVRLRSERAS